MSDGVVKASKAQKPCDIYRSASSSLSPSLRFFLKASKKLAVAKKMGQIENLKKVLKTNDRKPGSHFYFCSNSIFLLTKWRWFLCSWVMTISGGFFQWFTTSRVALYLLLRLLKTLWFWKVQNLEDAWGVTLLFRSYFWLVLAGKNHTLICGSQFSKAFFDRWLLLTKLACKRRIDPITSSALHAMMILASYQRVWIASISDNHLLIETILCNVKSFLFGLKLIFEFFLLVFLLTQMQLSKK